jgi:hypothetical protein
LAVGEKFDPVGGLNEPILYRYEEVGGLSLIVDKALRSNWG